MCWGGLRRLSGLCAVRPPSLPISSHARRDKGPTCSSRPPASRGRGRALGPSATRAAGAVHLSSCCINRNCCNKNFLRFTGKWTSANIWYLFAGCNFFSAPSESIAFLPDSARSAKKKGARCSGKRAQRRVKHTKRGAFQLPCRYSSSPSQCSARPAAFHNYRRNSPFSFLPPWHALESSVLLLSLFLFQEICCFFSFFFHSLLTHVFLFFFLTQHHLTPTHTPNRHV